ncbi:MAG: SpoIIE family protein phosphatase, partial [Bacteroidota bacterium]
LLSNSAIRIKELKQIKKNKQLLEAKNNELQNQKLIIEDKNQNITESIDYAKSVQRAILQFRVSERLKENFFTFYRPKAIVSGDFFWYSGLEGKDIIAAVDCTGHGVAGAFMTVIGSSCLDQIVNTDQIVSPAAILDNLGKSVSHALKQSLNGRSDHGMDVALCLIDYDKHEIRFAGANRSLYFFQNEEFKEIKGTRRSVGNMEIEYDDFTEHIIPFSPGDSFYLATDGYADQFGGSRNKKFMTVKFKKLLASIQHVSLKEQKSRLRESFEEWQGYNEQTDDVLVIGFRT